MSPIEIVAAILLVINVVLAVRENVWCWPVGIVGVILYGIVFYQNRWFANMGLQVVYTALSIQGWYQWLRGGEQKTALRVRHIPRTVLLSSLVAGFLLWGALAWLLMQTKEATFPLVDSWLTAFSLVAQYLMVRKYVENWLFWIAVDIIYIPAFLIQKLPVSSALYVLFLILATTGYFQWRKSAREPV